MNTIQPAIPVLTFLVVFGIFHKVQRDWRTAFLSACIVWGTTLVALTEVLSLFNLITLWAILAAWSLCFLIALVFWIRIVGSPSHLFRGMPSFEIPGYERLLLFGTVLIAILVGITAWFAPPNTNDSLTYHMSRVMHWIQDQSVAYYPTPILRQLYLNPGSEFIILHFQVLSGSDQYANLVQWFSMVGCAVGVSLIAKQLGANFRGQVVSAVVSLTIPMGILQGSSTQNDYVTAFWLTAYVYWMLVLGMRGGLWLAAASGASLGLAILTKSTAYIFALPFLLWGSFSLLRKYRAGAFRLLGTVASLVVLINMGYYLRNYDLFSNPLAVSTEVPEHYFIDYQIPNEVLYIPELVASNILRNIAIHLATPSDTINTYLQASIINFHKFINLSPNDPRTTWFETKFKIQKTSFAEDYDGNLLHLALIIIGMLFILLGSNRSSDLVYYSFSLIGAFLIFCLYLKWQPWNSRLHLPLFVLWSPIIGIAISWIKKEYFARTIPVILILGASPWILLNWARPLIGPQNVFITDRTTQYFRNQSLGPDYLGTIGFISNPTSQQCQRIGLYSDSSAPEYLWWILLKQEIGTNILIESVNVENVSKRKYADFPEFTPCLVIAVNSIQPETMAVEGTSFFKIQSYGSVSIYKPK
jgi:4-amino-4-deoxy-L-arabinose transferase-like glycosyltransferase